MSSLLSILSVEFLVLCFSVVLAIIGYYFHVFRRTIRRVRDWLRHR